MFKEFKLISRAIKRMLIEAYPPKLAENEQETATLEAENDTRGVGGVDFDHGDLSNFFEDIKG